MEVIACNNCTDFDTLASMVAASKLYKNAKLVISGSMDKSVREFYSLYQDIVPLWKFKDINPQDITLLVLVDTRIPDRLGPFKEVIKQYKPELHIYDHHPLRQDDIIGDKNEIRETGATVTILVDLIRKSGIDITPREATLFALGIYEDTGSLTFSTTTPLDVETVAYLLRKGARLEVISRFINHSLTEEQRILLNELLLRIKIHNIKGFSIVISTAEIEGFVQELAFLTHMILDMERKDAVFTIVRMKEKIYIVGRSKVQEIDVSNVLTYFDGGGHRTAASATLKTKESITQIEERLLEILNREVSPPILAQDIMSFPVKSISVDTPIREAREILQRSGHSGLVIVDGDRLVGIISRKDLDKAYYHNYGHAPVKAYMSKDIISVTPDTPITKVQELMIDKNVGRIPVVSDQHVVGIITRTDILRILHKLPLSFQPAPYIKVESLLRLPTLLQRVLRKAGKVGDQMNLPVYAIGGFVRDLILGVENYDLDIVVEGDGVEFGKKLARFLSGEVRWHNKFKTAVILLKEGYKIDIASARFEYYEEPGALPKVSYSSLQDDLARRDFTINTLAFSLNNRNFGQLYDYFGGYQDLQSGIIRVLHNLSFRDDPTRILRAIRFEQRYYFKMDPLTEKLLCEAVEEEMLKEVTVDRIRDELILILSERRPTGAIARMNQLGIWKLIHPRLDVNKEVEELIGEVSQVLSNFEGILAKENFCPWLIYFLALTFALSYEDIERLCRDLKFSKKIIKKLHFPTDYCKNLSLHKPLKASEIYNWLSTLSLEVLIFILTINKNELARQRIINYITRWRKMKPLLNGNDLLALGYLQSPMIGEALRKIHNAYIDGEIKNREEAIELARRLLIKF